ISAIHLGQSWLEQKLRYRNMTGNARHHRKCSSEIKRANCATSPATSAERNIGPQAEERRQVLSVAVQCRKNACSLSGCDWPDSEVKYLLRMHDELVKLYDHLEARAGQSKRQRRRLRLDLRLVSNLIVR